MRLCVTGACACMLCVHATRACAWACARATGWWVGASVGWLTIAPDVPSCYCQHACTIPAASVRAGGAPLLVQGQSTLCILLRPQQCLC